MNLLEYNYEKDEFVASPQALVLEPIKNLWDSRKDKSIASKELSYIFFMVNKTNELKFWREDDEEVRSTEVIKHVFGKNSKWIPDEKVYKALEFYKENTITFAEDYLNAVIHGANKAMEYLNNVNWDLKDKSGKFIYDINKIKASLKEAPEIIDAVEKVRSKVYEQEKTSGNKRGQREIGIFENGNNL